MVATAARCGTALALAAMPHSLPSVVGGYFQHVSRGWLDDRMPVTFDAHCGSWTAAATQALNAAVAAHGWRNAAKTRYNAGRREDGGVRMAYCPKNARRWQDGACRTRTCIPVMFWRRGAWLPSHILRCNSLFGLAAAAILPPLESRHLGGRWRADTHSRTRRTPYKVARRMLNRAKTHIAAHRRTAGCAVAARAYYSHCLGFRYLPEIACETTTRAAIHLTAKASTRRARVRRAP